ALVLLGGVAFGVLRVAQWFQERNDVKVEAAAADNLELARKLTADKKFEEAQALLDPILTRVTNPAFRPEAHLLQANILIDSDRNEEALEHLRAAAQDYPS